MGVGVEERGAAASASVLVDGLTLSTSMDVPGARPVAAEPDWEIERVAAPPQFEAGATHWLGTARYCGELRGRFGRADEAQRVQLEDVGELVAWPAEKRAVIHVSAGASDDVAALSQLLAFLACIEGKTALHGACVSFPVGAILFCAGPKTGKSTLALALDAIGRPVLADDHVVLDPEEKRFAAHPSIAFIDASRESRRLFRPDTLILYPRHAAWLSTPPPSAPVPVTRVAFLRRGEEPAVRRLSAEEGAAGLRECLVTLDESENGAADAARRSLRLARSVVSLELIVPEGLRRLSRELELLQELLVYS